ncbi:MAG TPA: hypothetical protein PKH77_00730 [Anaerolineae bacterium]|nr:hypothetical protein [Anaerolineae bacterium]
MSNTTCAACSTRARSASGDRSSGAGGVFTTGRFTVGAAGVNGGATVAEGGGS